VCLGVPGQIVELVDDHEHLAKVEVSGVRRVINVGLLTDPPPGVGDWVLIHVGFAIAAIDEDEARLALASLRMLGADGERGDLGDLGGTFEPPPGWEAAP